MRHALASASRALPVAPSNLRSTFIDRSHKTLVSIGSSNVATFHHTQATTDCGARPVPLKCVGGYRPPVRAYCKFASALRSGASANYNNKNNKNYGLCAAVNEAEQLMQEQQSALARESGEVFQNASIIMQQQQQSVVQFGERVEELGAYWGQRFFGNVTHGFRNFGYPWSRWYIRRYGMKKHRYTKRWKVRRYKLASVANLPFAKMIRINMLPELKSKKGNKAAGGGFDVDAAAAPTVATQISSAANSLAGGGRVGRRHRPKSKYT